MAALHLYKCEKCGWDIHSPSEGKDLLMGGRMFYFICKDCKHVFRRTVEYGHENEMNTTCPKCDSSNTTDWKPKDGCPKCGGKLKNQGLVCLMD